MKKTDYRDVWVYIEQGRRGVSAVSLELCCRLRGLCDEMGERLAAVVMEPVPEGLIAELADCGVERVIRVGGSGHEEYSSEVWRRCSRSCAGGTARRRCLWAQRTADGSLRRALRRG